MNSPIEQARFNMIEQQIRPWNVLDKGVLETLLLVPREAFVPPTFEHLAFADTDLPLTSLISSTAQGERCECMLAPKIEARLLQEAQLKKHESVLEIGTGSGYMAALMARCARRVTTVEIQPELAAFASANLKKSCIDNVEVLVGDGAQGWPIMDPRQTNKHAGKVEPMNDDNLTCFDVIMISGALPTLPDRFLRQLNVGGRILAIIGHAPIMTVQRITRVTSSRYDTINLFDTLTAPLTQMSPPSSFVF